MSSSAALGAFLPLLLWTRGLRAATRASPSAPGTMPTAAASGQRSAQPAVSEYAKKGVEDPRIYDGCQW